MSRIPSRDHYFRRAKKDKYPARSVYKLEEIDKRMKLFRAGQQVLDLGAYPGSWSMYASHKVGPKGRVLAMDLKPLETEIPGVSWRTADVTEVDPEALLAEEGPFDLVISDMAPNTTGHKAVDAARSHHLCVAAFGLARRVLKSKGHVVVKAFMGEDFPELMALVRREFKASRTIKPAASLKESRETYLVAWEPLS